MAKDSIVTMKYISCESEKTLKQKKIVKKLDFQDKGVAYLHR
jgi:hypothetical protein